VAVDEVGRVHLVGAVALLHPEAQVVEEMLQGWRNQQLSRNLQFATIEQRARYVRRFIVHVNEFPWRWTPSHVEEYFGDLRSITQLRHATLRGQQCALRHFTSYIANPRLRLGPRLRAVVRYPSGAGVLRLEHRRPCAGI